MHTVTYYKFGSKWFIDCPDYIDKGGNADDLEKIGSFHEFLEFASQGETTVVFLLNETPFDHADVLERTGFSGDDTGGYYQITSFNSQPVDFELWFNEVCITEKQHLPERFYIRKA
jgi:hypothetical protein